MTCERMRGWILRADPAELRTPDGERAEHLASCERCREAVDRVVEGHGTLVRTLGDLRPRIPVEVALERLEREVAEEAPGRRWMRAIALPLAAALGGLMIWQGFGPFSDGDGLREPLRGVPGAPGSPGSAIGAAQGPGSIRSGIRVSADPSKRVLVLPTRNPDISVIWLIDKGEEP